MLELAVAQVPITVLAGYREALQLVLSLLVLPVAFRGHQGIELRVGGRCTISDPAQTRRSRSRFPFRFDVS
jgi:hypothetical protein